MSTPINHTLKQLFEESQNNPSEKKIIIATGSEGLKMLENLIEEEAKKIGIILQRKKEKK